MFFSIAWRNAKRSRSENLIYFLTMVTAIATFYIVLSLGEQDVMRFLSELESDAVDRLLTKLLPTVYLCALLFVFSLVIFANKYQLECRSRELGLYLLFGMTKPRLFIQIMAEGLISSLLALLGGLICGGFLSEISSLATARLVGYGIIAHQSTVEKNGLLQSIMQAEKLLKPSGLYYESYLDNFGRQLFYVISGSYTTLYMGFMLLIIACAVLALQFLTQMRATRARYATLSILGARREQMKRSINQQVLWYFLLPMLLACLSGTVGVYAMQHA